MHPLRSVFPGGASESEGHAEQEEIMEHIRQSRPDSGPGFQAKVLKPFKGVPSSLGSGTPGCTWLQLLKAN